MNDILKKVKQYAGTAWKWFRLFAGTRTALWLINSLLIPAILNWLKSEGISLPLEAVKEIVSLVTGQAVDAMTASVALGGMIAAGGTMLANDTLVDFRRRALITRHGDEEGLRRFQDWVDKKAMQREAKEARKRGDKVFDRANRLTGIDE